MRSVAPEVFRVSSELVKLEERLLHATILNLEHIVLPVCAVG